MQRVLLTGSRGFIGRNLVTLLNNDYEILTPSSQELDLTDTLAVQKYLDEHPIDAVIHSATTPGHRNALPVSDLVARNLRMFHNLMRCREAYGKFLYLSSGAIYDMRSYQDRMSESYFDTSVPIDPHGFSKYVIGKFAELNTSVVELRLFGVFGPHEDYAIRFISNAICKALKGMPITLRQDRLFDYLYIDDLAPILRHFLSASPSHNIFNVTPDESVSLLMVAELIRELTGAEVPILVGETGLGLPYTGDNSRLREEVPNIEFSPIREAIKKLIEWYREHIHLVDSKLLIIDK